jgi:hypothetical protein
MGSSCRAFETARVIVRHSYVAFSCWYSTVVVNSSTTNASSHKVGPALAHQQSSEPVKALEHLMLVDIRERIESYDTALLLGEQLVQVRCKKSVRKASLLRLIEQVALFF